MLNFTFVILLINYVLLRNTNSLEMKTNITQFSPSHFFQLQLINERNNTTISEVPDTKFLGVQIDKHLNCMCHINWILPKLCTAGFVIRRLFYVLI